MAAGKIVLGECVPESRAADYYYSSFNPTVVPGATSYYSKTFKSGASWFLETYSYPGNSFVSQAKLASVTFPSCETLSPVNSFDSFQEGHVLGWGVAAAMVVAWSIHALRRAI